MTGRGDLRFLLEAWRPHRSTLAVVVLASFLGSLCDGLSIGLLVPLLGTLQGAGGEERLPGLLGHAQNLLAPLPGAARIRLAVGLVVAAILLKNALIGVSIYHGYRVSSRLAADLRARAARMLLGVGLEYYHRTKAGELIEKALYNPAYVEEISRYAVEMAVQAMTFLVLVGLLLLLSWPLTLIALGIGAVIMWFTAAFTRRQAGAGKAFAESSRDLLTGVHESIAGIQLIRAAAAEAGQLERILRTIDLHRRHTLRLNFGNYAVHLLTDVLGAGAIGALFLVAMLLFGVETQALIVILLPFVYVISRVIPVLKQFNLARAVLVSRWPFLLLVRDFLRPDDKPVVRNGRLPFPGLDREIRLDGVTFAYAGAGRPALAEIGFAIPRGRTTAIVGQSGSGKTTLANLLLRFYDPQRGAVLVDGVPLPEFDLDSYRRRVGVVSQDVFIFNDTVKFNLAFGAGEGVTAERIVAAARQAGAHDFIMELPAAYDTVLGDRGVKLSGGQRQRLSIARAVLRDPEILILDEATSSLDARMERLIHQAILELRRGRTVVVIAHRLSTIEDADQIVVLKEGRIVEVGTAPELRRQGGEFHRLSRSGGEA